MGILPKPEGAQTFLRTRMSALRQHRKNPRGPRANRDIAGQGVARWAGKSLECPARGYARFERGFLCVCESKPGGAPLHLQSSVLHPLWLQLGRAASLHLRAFAFVPIASSRMMSQNPLSPPASIHLNHRRIRNQLCVPNFRSQRRPNARCVHAPRAQCQKPETQGSTASLCAKRKG